MVLADPNVGPFFRKVVPLCIYSLVLKSELLVFNDTCDPKFESLFSIYLVKQKASSNPLITDILEY